MGNLQVGMHEVQGAAPRGANARFGSAHVRHTKDVWYIFLYGIKLKNVSCEYDRLNGWNFATCLAHQTRSLDMLMVHFTYNSWYYVCELNLPYGW